MDPARGPESVRGAPATTSLCRHRLAVLLVTFLLAAGFAYLLVFWYQNVKRSDVTVFVEKVFLGRQGV